MKSNRPDAWTDLAGPYRGTFDLPVSGQAILGGQAWQFSSAYRALLFHGTPDMVRRYVNPRRLLQAWPTMTRWRFGSAVRYEWETAFPQLCRQLVYAVATDVVRDKPAVAQLLAAESDARVVVVAEQGERGLLRLSELVGGEMVCYGRKSADEYLSGGPGAAEMPPHIVWVGV